MSARAFRPLHRPLTTAQQLRTVPRWLRPKLDRRQQRDLNMAHHVNLDAIARGEADDTLLWQWVGGVLVWWHVARALRMGEAELQQQRQLADRVVQRWRATGRVHFEGDDYAQARDGVIVMDELAAVVDQPTASAAADWSQAQIDRPTVGADSQHATA